ncbi:MAG: cation:proton antiporter [Candidatus Micrarchaeota archaeon]
MLENSIPVLISLIGLIIFVGYLASRFFDRTKIPDVLFLILLGVLLGPIFHVLDGSVLIDLAPLIGSIALIIIVFEGGTKLNFFEVIEELPESIWFTVAVSGFTAIAVMLVFLFGAGFDWIRSLLAGIIVAGTSYEIIAPLVAKLTVTEKVKTLLNLESALNDVVTIIGMVIMIQLFTHAGEPIFPIQLFISTFAIAILLGAIAGAVWLKVLENFKGKQFEYLLTLGFVFLLYSGSEALQGNGITSVMLFGLILGNAPALAKLFSIKEDFDLDPAIRNFNSEVSFFVRTMFFVYVGVVISFEDLTQDIIIIAFLMFVASLIARFAAVRLLTSMNKSLRGSDFIITAMLPRGLATAVLATIPITYGINLGAILEITLLFMIFTDIFGTIAAYYFETKLAARASSASTQMKK